MSCFNMHLCRYQCQFQHKEQYFGPSSVSQKWLEILLPLITSISKCEIISNILLPLRPEPSHFIYLAQLATETLYEQLCKNHLWPLEIYVGIRLAFQGCGNISWKKKKNLGREGEQVKTAKFEYFTNKNITESKLGQYAIFS